MARKRKYPEVKGYWVYSIQVPSVNKYYIGISKRQCCQRWRKSQYKSNSLNQYLDEWDSMEKTVLVDNLTKEQAYLYEGNIIQALDMNDLCINSYRSGLITNDAKQYYEDNKEKYQEYYENNKEQRKEYQKQYREDNKEQIREYNKQYQKQRYQTDDEFREKAKQQQKEYRENPEYRERQKQWQKDNREKWNEYQREYQRQRRLKKKLEQQNQQLNLFS